MTENQREMLPVLLYHRVVKPGFFLGKHKIWVKEKNLEAQLAWLKNNGYETITFKQLAQQHIKLQPKNIILTFDDGYEDNYTVLYPLLKKYGFTATIYLVTGTDHNAWGVKEGEPRIPLMTHAMIKEMADYGVEFGGHTHTHIDLSRATPDEVSTELTLNFNVLTDILGHAPVSFAYPFGGLNERVKQKVKEAGYLFAVATNTGAIYFQHDPYQIRRMEIRPQNGLLRFTYKASGLYFRRSYAGFLWDKIRGNV